MTKKKGPPALGDFPEITGWEARCRVCKLIRDEPGVARVVHGEWRSRMAEDGTAPQDAVADVVAPMLSKHGIKPLSGQVLARHFGRHVGDAASWGSHLSVVPGGMPDPEEAAVGSVTEVAAARLAKTLATMKAADARTGALGQHDSDYFRMNTLFTRLVARIEALDKDPSAFFTTDSRHDMHKLNVWTGMISSARAILADLNKMRNSDRLTASILEQHTLRLSQSLAAGLGEELRPVQAALASGDQARAQELLGEVMGQRVPALFRQAAADALDMTKTKYGLMN